jgi:deoxyribonuclease V
MEPVRPAFLPRGSLSREEMESLQHEISSAAIFRDEGPFNRKDESATASLRIAGVDQGFEGDTATSAIVVLEGDTVVERAHASEPVEIPYIPGLLAFREGGAIVSAFEAIEQKPDLVLVDGCGRMHYREAGLATHIGVLFDIPTIGVAKNILCGEPRESLADPLPAGDRVAIEADDEMTTETGTLIAYAVQTRQFDSPNRHVNPVYVSPGHRVSAETAADVVEAQSTEYKLPEPIRQADAAAADLVE